METVLGHTLRRCLFPTSQEGAQGGRKERSGSSRADFLHVLMSRWVLPSGETLGIPSHICKAPFSTELLGQAPCQLSPWQESELGILGPDWTHWTGTKTTLEWCPTHYPASCQGQGLPPLPRTKLKVPVEEGTLWNLPGLPSQSA